MSRQMKVVVIAGDLLKQSLGRVFTNHNSRTFVEDLANPAYLSRSIRQTRRRRSHREQAPAFATLMIHGQRSSSWKISNRVFVCKEAMRPCRYGGKRQIVQNTIRDDQEMGHILQITALF